MNEYSVLARKEVGLRKRRFMKDVAEYFGSKIWKRRTVLPAGQSLTFSSKKRSTERSFIHGSGQQLLVRTISLSMKMTILAGQQALRVAHAFPLVQDLRLKVRFSG